MPRMPEADADALFRPYRNLLVECVRGAVTDYFTLYPPKLRTIHSRRTRANIIRDHMVARAQLAFQNVPGTNLVIAAGRGRYFLLSVKGRALARFKMLGLKKAARNYPTPLAERFRDNRRLIPDLPPATRFDVGYVWNKLQTGIETIAISCPAPNGVEYTIDLWMDAPPSALNLPQVGARPDGTPPTRVRPNKDTTTKTQGADGTT